MESLATGPLPTYGRHQGRGGGRLLLMMACASSDMPSPMREAWGARREARRARRRARADRPRLAALSLFGA